MLLAMISMAQMHRFGVLKPLQTLVHFLAWSERFAPVLPLLQRSFLAALLDSLLASVHGAFALGLLGHILVRLGV